MNKTWLRFRISDILFITILLLALFLGKQMLSLDSDIGRHLAMGNYMLNERLVPTTDLFSHTRNGFNRPPYEWLSQILFAIADRLLGLDGVILLTSLIIALTFTLAYRFAHLRSGSPLIAMMFTFVAVGASSIHWLPRPHIFTLLFLTIWIESLDRLVRGGRIGLYLFPLTMLFWANLHGGFIFGILAWIAYMAGWLWEASFGRSDRQIGRKLLAAGIFSIFATIFTPDLWRNWQAVLNNRSTFILNRTVETMPPSLTDASFFPFIFLLIVALFFFAWNWRKINPGHVFLLAGLGSISLLMARNIPIFVVAAVPILSKESAEVLSRSKTWMGIDQRFSGFGSAPGQSVWSFIAVLLATAFFTGFKLGYGKPLHQFDPQIFPVEAANFIEANPQHGNMFNDFNWGGYLLYRLWPEYKVFLDSQSDFYGEGLVREYDQIITMDDGWQDLLEKYHVVWMIIPSDSPLAEEIAGFPAWETIHEDPTAVILKQK